MSYSWEGNNRRDPNAPLDGEILYLAILIVQRLDDVVDRPGGYVVVVLEKFGLRIIQN